MGFLRRLLGTNDDQGGSDRAKGSSEPAEGSSDPVGGSGATPWPRGHDDHLPDDEVERDRALLRAEAERLDDDLIQRQLRYADRSWTPPAEGGERRADDPAAER